MPDLTFKISSQFSRTPGPRNRDEGDFSGQQFLEEHLRPLFKEVVESGSVLQIDLDGTAGYATSFLEESFGGLTRESGEELVRKHLTFRTEDEPYLIEEIDRYIREAKDPK